MNKIFNKILKKIRKDFKQNIQKNIFVPEDVSLIDKETPQKATEYINNHLMHIEAGQSESVPINEELQSKYADKLKHPIIQMVLQVCHEVDSENFSPEPILRNLELKDGEVNHNGIASVLNTIKSYHKHLSSAVERAILDKIGERSDALDTQKKVNQILAQQQALDAQNFISQLQEVILRRTMQDGQKKYIESLIQNIESKKAKIQELKEKYNNIQGDDLGKLIELKESLETQGLSKIFVGFYNNLNGYIERMENAVYDTFSENEYQKRKERILRGRCITEISKSELHALEDLQDRRFTGCEV